MNYLVDGLRQALLLLAQGDAATFSAVWTTLAVTFEAMAATLVCGVPAGFFLGYATFPGKRAARLLVETFLSFPTVVIGLVVYAFLSRRGPLGEWGLLFTVPGMSGLRGMKCIAVMLGALQCQDHISNILVSLYFLIYCQGEF